MVRRRSVPGGPLAAADVAAIAGNRAAVGMGLSRLRLAAGVVQRHIKGPAKNYIDFGGANSDGVGTTMAAELGWTSPAIPKGTKPSVAPGWWPGSSDPAHDFFTNYMVQGHLLNQQVGGTGKDMKNLTPITKSANSMHNSKIENAVKTHCKADRTIVDYHVSADYSKHPKGDEMAPNESSTVQGHIDTNYAPKLAHKIAAEFTAWAWDAGAKKWKSSGDRWEIGNEAKEIT